ncbi:MAG: hypothetical protein WC979_02545 [Candidatus Pacearchaeota archaeon]|nr:hypothetical protein [Clostridia bacterium]
MYKRIPTFDEHVNEGTWNNEKYGFRISKFLEQHTGKNLTGEMKVQIIFNDFFKASTYEYANNLLLCSRIEGYIKSYKILEHDRLIGSYRNIFIVDVDVIKWYEFLRKLDDGHLDNFKIL